jgi:PTS system mannose-specific IIA component
MIKIILVAHGKLAQELVNSTESIIGKQSNLYAIKRGTNDSLAQMKERLRTLLQSINDENGTLILTDLIGGTPCNASTFTCQSFNTEILSGVNLPMVLSATFLSKNDLSVSELVDKVLFDGQKGIINVKKMLLKT